MRRTAHARRRPAMTTLPWLVALTANKSSIGAQTQLAFFSILSNKCDLVYIKSVYRKHHDLHESAPVPARQAAVLAAVMA